MATVVMRHCCSHSFSRCRSWVNVSKLRTGLGSRSCGTATKISVAPTSIPAALGSMQLRLGTAPPWPARFCFLLLVRPCFFLLDHGVGQVVFSQVISLIGIAAVQHNRVTTVSITKLGTKLGERASKHHCIVGLLPTTMMATSIPSATPCLQHPACRLFIPLLTR